MVNLPSETMLYLIAGLAAAAAGAVNALAGGGTLITFPVLLAVGLPAVAANVTNTVALCPGYLGGAVGQAEDLRGQRRRLLWTVPVAAIGGGVGAVLLLATGERLFRELVPLLILAGCILVAAQDAVRRWVARRLGVGASRVGRPAMWTIPLVGAASVYGGYFGAGLSAMLLGVLGLDEDDSLTRLNAVKQVLALAVNLAAALVFARTGMVAWPVAAIMAVGALIGGGLGGRLAGRVRAEVLRWTVVTFGVLVAFAYWLA